MERFVQNVFRQDDEPSISSSEKEFNQLPVNYEHSTSHVSRWLPPIPLKSDKSRYNAIVMYVDMQCNVYFQIDDDDHKQLLHDTMEYLNEEFCNSTPEPINYQWSVGQMVIVQYHLDKKWYRGTIIKIEKNKTFEVQFLDFGNVEMCTHEELRSTVSMTDIPQLCFKGFLCTICPLTKDKKWTVPVLDFLHAMIVDHHCTMVIDFTKSTDNNYAITHMQNDTILDVCQYMVTNDYAYYSYMDVFNFNFMDIVQEMDTDAPQKDDYQSCNDNNTSTNEPYHCSSMSSAVASSGGGSSEESKNNNIQDSEVDNDSEEEINCNLINAAFPKLKHVHNEESHVHLAVETNSDGYHQQINRQSILNRETEHFYGDNNASSVKNAAHSETDDCVEDENVNRYVQQSTLSTESDDSSVKHNTWSAMYRKVKHPVSSKNSDDGKILSTTTMDYSRINFKCNDVIEGTLSEVVASTRMTLLVEKINNVDLSIFKDNMYHIIMSMQCDKLPKINEIVPNTSVVVFHDHLWKRGIISNNSSCVYLVDFGKSIKLIEKDLRLCPKILLKSPIFSIDCQLAHVSKSETCNEPDVVEEMTKVLRGFNLKIVRIDELNADIVHVELYNDKKEIAYQSLIDSGVLVPK